MRGFPDKEGGKNSQKFADFLYGWSPEEGYARVRDGKSGPIQSDRRNITSVDVGAILFLLLF